MESRINKAISVASVAIRVLPLIFSELPLLVVAHNLLLTGGLVEIS